MRKQHDSSELLVNVIAVGGMIIGALLVVGSLVWIVLHVN